MDLFTIKFELGPETRSLIERVTTEMCATGERVAKSTVVHVELGEKTRQTIETLAVASRGAGGKTRDAVVGVVEKAREEARRASRA